MKEYILGITEDYKPDHIDMIMEDKIATVVAFNCDSLEIEYTELEMSFSEPKLKVKSEPIIQHVELTSRKSKSELF